MTTKHIIHILSVLLIIVMHTVAAHQTPRAIALGDGISAIAGSGFGEALSKNPAGLFPDKSGCIIYYDEGFAIDGYESKGANFEFAVGKIGFGVFSYDTRAVLIESPGEETNTNGFCEKKAGIGFAIKNQKISYGVGIWNYAQNFHLFDSTQLSSISYVAADFGLQYLKEKMGIGIVVRGIPFSNSRGVDREVEYCLGLRMGKVNEIISTADFTIAKNSIGEYETIIHGGVESWLLPNLAVRIGLDYAGMFTAGIGVGKNKLQFDYAYKAHPAGRTHYLATSYRF